MAGGLPRLIGLVLALAVYCLPALLAWRKRHPLRQRLLVANVLFGWTVIGWLICLAVALDLRPSQILRRRPRTP